MSDVRDELDQTVSDELVERITAEVLRQVTALAPQTERSLESLLSTPTLAVSRRSDRLEEVAVLNATRLRQARQKLVDSGALTVAELAAGRGAELNTTHQWLRRGAKTHRLLAVTTSNKTLVPLGLLDEAFDPIPAWQPVLEALHQAGESSWGAWAWIATETSWLDGQRPIDLIDSEPDLVMRAAKARCQASASTEAT